MLNKLQILQINFSKMFSAPVELYFNLVQDLTILNIFLSDHFPNKNVVTKSLQLSFSKHFSKDPSYLKTTYHHHSALYIKCDCSLTTG